jgi:hypothetical protein
MVTYYKKDHIATQRSGARKLIATQRCGARKL